MSRKNLSIFVLSALLLVVSPVRAFAADANVGNEVVDTFNTTLTRTGAGTAANPYKLQLNVGNANTWIGAQTFNSTLTANGILNLGDGGDAASFSGTTVTINTGDNNANAFLVQQGTIKYLQVNTTNNAENIVFGNTTTNPTYTFLGSGATTFSGAVIANGTIQGSTLNAASAIQLNGTDINTAGVLSNIAYKNQANTFTSTNVFSNAAPIVLSQTNPNITLGAANANGSLSIKDSAGSPNTLLSLYDNGTSGTINVANINATSALQLAGTDINIPGVLSNVAYSLQDNNFTTGQTINGQLTVTSGGASIIGGLNNNSGGIANTGAITGATNITASGSITANNALTVNGAVTFTPSGTNSVTIDTDTDSFLKIPGLTTATGDGLCIDASNNVIKCSGSPSDIRLKKNITPLTDVLPRVLKAQGVRYDLLKDADSAPGEGKNIGFIAQELEVLFPEVVKTDAKGIKSVDYEKMTAVLVESTKEQQKQIDELKAEVQALKDALQNK